MPNQLPAAVGFRLVPGNFAPMKGADRHGHAQENACGHSVDIWLKVEDGVITAATYTTDGCESFIHSGSLVAHLSQGRTLGEARSMDAGEVIKAFGADDASARDCAALALRALWDAAASPS